MSWRRGCHPQSSSAKSYRGPIRRGWSAGNRPNHATWKHTQFRRNNKGSCHVFRVRCCKIAGSFDAQNVTGDVFVSISFWIEEITFSDGQSLRLTPGSTTIVVGPNNSGKTSMLRELFRAFAGAQSGQWYQAEVCRNGKTSETLRSGSIRTWLSCVQDTGNMTCTRGWARVLIG